MIGFIADRVAVMYLGKIVELAETEDLFTAAQASLHRSPACRPFPIPDPRLRDEQQHIILTGEIPSARKPPPGCPFHPRCRYAEENCATDLAPLRMLDDGRRHLVACHYPDRVQFGLPLD